MFSNLSKGSVLYGIETKGDIKLFTGTVESVSIPRPRYIQNTFGQIPDTVIDITVNIGGERKEFKQVPSINAIADFGPESFVLSDSKDSLVNYVNSMLQNSRNIVSSVDKHKVLIEQYEQVLDALNPSTVNNNAVKELKGQVIDIQNQMQEILSLLKSGDTKTKN